MPADCEQAPEAVPHLQFFNHERSQSVIVGETNIASRCMTWQALGGFASTLLFVALVAMSASQVRDMLPVPLQSPTQRGLPSLSTPGR